MASSAKKSNNSFSMLPWKESFREGGMRSLSNPEIKVLPIIAAHANKNTRKAWPSYGRICALARASKATVAEAIDALVAKKLIAKSSDMEGTRSHNVYQLLFIYNQDNEDESYKDKWIALHHELFYSGVWGAMIGSARRVYLILRAFAWAGRSAATDEYYNYPDEAKIIEVDDGERWRRFHHTRVQFLPLHKYNPEEFAYLSDISKRALYDGMAWLTANRLIIPYDVDSDRGEPIAGFIIPFRPGRYVPDVEESVRKAKEESSTPKARPGAQRSFKALCRKVDQKKAAPSAGKKLERR